MGLPKQTGLEVANVHLETIAATKANEEKEEQQREVRSSGLHCSRSFANVLKGTYCFLCQRPQK